MIERPDGIERDNAGLGWLARTRPCASIGKGAR